jgi:CHAD domain-containing protein
MFTSSKIVQTCRYLAELAPRSSRRKAAVEALPQIQDSIGDWHDVLTLIDVAEGALKSPKESAFIVELRNAAQKKLQESLAACQNAKQGLLRLESEQLAAQRKRPQSAHAPSRAARSRAAGWNATLS